MPPESFGPKDNTLMNTSDIHKDLVSAFCRREGGLQVGASSGAGQRGGIPGGASCRAGQGDDAALTLQLALADVRVRQTPAEVDAGVGRGAAATGRSVRCSSVNNRLVERIVDPSGQRYGRLNDASIQFQATGNILQPGASCQLSRTTINYKLGLGAYDAGWRASEHPVDATRIRAQSQCIVRRVASNFDPHSKLRRSSRTKRPP